MEIFIFLSIIELWIILGLISLHFFSYFYHQKVQITDISVILLSFVYGPFTYRIMVHHYKENDNEE
jgi:hypothetical protein